MDEWDIGDRVMLSISRVGAGKSMEVGEGTAGPPPPDCFVDGKPTLIIYRPEE